MKHKAIQIIFITLTAVLLRQEAAWFEPNIYALRPRAALERHQGAEQNGKDETKTRFFLPVPGDSGEFLAVTPDAEGGEEAATKWEMWRQWARAAMHQFYTTIGIHGDWEHFDHLIYSVRFLDSEALHYNLTDDGRVFIATRGGSRLTGEHLARIGINERIRGIMGKMKAKEEKGYPREFVCPDFAQKKIPIIVYCYKMRDFKKEAPEETKAKLEALLRREKGFEGDASIPDYTTSGIIALLGRKDYQPEPFDNAEPLTGGEAWTSRMDTVYSRLESSVRGAEETVTDMQHGRKPIEAALTYLSAMKDLFQILAGEGTGLPAAWAEAVKQVTESKNKTEIMKRRDEVLKRFAYLTGIAREELAEETEPLTRDEMEEIFLAASGKRLGDVYKMGGIQMRTFMLNEELRARLQQIPKETRLRLVKALMEAIRINQGNLDGIDMMRSFLQQFWFHLIHPAKDYMEENLDLNSPVTVTEKLPIIVFAESIKSPMELVFLAKRYNVQAIVTRNATVTSHWVLVAKDMGIPVIIVNIPQERSLREEVAKFIKKMSNTQEKDGVLRRLALVRSNSTSHGKVVLGPDVSTAGAFEQYMVAEIAFDKVAEAEANVLGAKAVGIPPSHAFVSLLGNADNAEEVKKCLASHHAAGIGLVRTEYSFEGDAVRQYLEEFFKEKGQKDNRLKEARAQLRQKIKDEFVEMQRLGRDVTIRTIDYENDKETLIHRFIKELSATEEWEGLDDKVGRGIEFYRDEVGLGRDILAIQFEAAIEAHLEIKSGLKKGEGLKILVPMVSAAADAEGLITGRGSVLAAAKNNVLERLKGSAEFKESLEGPVDEIPIGIMIETDKAIDNIEELLSNDGIDFYSIGTNDLSRYVVARAIMEKEKGGLGPGDVVMPLERDEPANKDYLSRLQPSVTKAIFRVIEAMVKVNRERLASGKPLKRLGVCGEMASWYTFHIFLADTLNKLEVGEELPLTLSMAGYRVPAVNIFLRNIKEEDGRRVNDFFAHTAEVPLDTVVNRAVGRVFQRIHETPIFTAVHKMLKDELDEKTDEELANPPEEMRTLFTLRLIKRKSGKIEALPTAIPQSTLPKPLNGTGLKRNSSESNI